MISIFVRLRMEKLLQFLFIFFFYIVILLIIFVSVRHFKTRDDFPFRPSFAFDSRTVHFLEFILMRLCKIPIFPFVLGNSMSCMRCLIHPFSKKPSAGCYASYHSNHFLLFKFLVADLSKVA